MTEINIIMVVLAMCSPLPLAILIELDNRKDNKALAEATASHRPVVIKRGAYRHVFFPTGWYAPALWMQSQGWRASKWLKYGDQFIAIVKA